MSSKLKPALLGGLIVGVLSAIFSQIPIVSVCCCIWSIVGGTVAGLIYIKGSPTRVPTGDGAMVGALAGLVGAVIYLIISLPLALFLGAAAIEDALKKSGVEVPLSGALLLVIGALLGAICLIILSTVGGLLAIPIFEKRKDDATPPPPTTGGGYAA